MTNSRPNTSVCTRNLMNSTKNNASESLAAVSVAFGEFWYTGIHVKSLWSLPPPHSSVPRPSYEKFFGDPERSSVDPQFPKILADNSYGQESGTPLISKLPPRLVYTSYQAIFGDLADLLKIFQDHQKIFHNSA